MSAGLVNIVTLDTDAGEGLYINHCTRTRGENNMTESEHFSSHPWLSLMFIFAKGNV